VESYYHIYNGIISKPTREKPMNTQILKLSCLTLLSLLLLAACSKEKEVQKEIIRPVRYQKVELSGSGQSRTFSGVSKAAMEVKLSFKVGGTVKSVKVKVGDKVKKGKVIAVLEKTDLQLRYEQAKVAVSNARIQMQTAKSAFERTAALYENNNVSLQDFERVKTAYESAKAVVSSKQRSLQLASSQLSYATLTAPMDGIVTEVKVENNENVGPGKVVAELNSGNDIEVSIGIPESYIAKVKEGDKVEVQFPSINGAAFKGVVSEVSYAISSSSSTYPVNIVLENPSEKIRPGMAAEVAFAFKSEAKASKIVAPVNTVSEDQTGRFVYTVTQEEDGSALVHRKAVTVGELTDEGLEILEGLQDGELIVTAGISKLSDSIKVKLLK
jgi:RND family efflux transporter MFP subunit